MKSASIQDLRFSFGKIENLLRQGEEIQITDRRQVVATLVPEATSGKPAMPDFIGRIRAIYGDECLVVSGTTLIGEDRDPR